jgi:hypothetical protein
LID